MSDKKYTPGYIEVPGKGQRYQDSSGKLYNNHFGPSLNQVGNFFGSIGPAYNSYYNNFADAVGTERRDGTVAKPKTKKTPKVVEAAVSQTPDARLGSVDTPTPYPTEAVTKPVPKKPPVVPTGRDTAPPDGSQAKGTSMGSSVLQMDEVNEILNKRGVPALADPFSSNNLPGIDYSAEDAAVMGRSRQDSAVIGLGGSVETTPDGSKPPVSVLQRQGSPELVGNGAISVDSPGSAALSPATSFVVDKLGNTIGGKDGSPETASFDMARRRAFLDAGSGLRGMEAVKAQKGMATSVGQSYIVDPNNDGQMMSISQDDKRTLLGRDQQKAQDLLGSYVKAIKPKEEDPAV